MGIYIYLMYIYIYHIRHNGIKATKRCKHRLRLQREISRVAKKKIDVKLHTQRKKVFFLLVCQSQLSITILQPAEVVRWSHWGNHPLPSFCRSRKQSKPLRPMRLGLNGGPGGPVAWRETGFLWCCMCMIVYAIYIHICIPTMYMCICIILKPFELRMNSNHMGRPHVETNFVTENSTKWEHW